MTFPKISDLGKDDITHILGYVLGFLAAYAVYMSTNHVDGWFSWGALATGLTASGSYHLGSNMNWRTSQPNQTGQPIETDDKETH